MLCHRLLAGLGALGVGAGQIDVVGRQFHFELAHFDGDFYHFVVGEKRFGPVPEIGMVFVGVVLDLL